MDKDLMHSAYHEAGHAIVQWAVAVGIDDITIIEDDDSLGKSTRSVVDGYAETPNDPLPTDREALEEYYQADNEIEPGDFDQRCACVALAGQVTQVKFDPPIGDKGCDNDIKSAALYIDNFSHSDSAEVNEGWWTALRNRTTELVDYYWPEIDALAKHLLNTKTVTGDEAIRIINSSLASRKGDRIAWVDTVSQRN